MWLEDLTEELFVVFSPTDAVEDPFEVFEVGEVGESASEFGDLSEFERLEEAIFAAGAGFGDVDSGKESTFGDSATEDELAVPGAFKFLENDFIHFAAGVDESGSDDGDSTAGLEVTSSAEELSGPVESAGGDAAGESAALVAVEVVVSASEACDGVEEDYNVIAGKEAFKALEEDGFGESDVVDGAFVGGGCFDANVKAAAKISGLFGTFIDEKSDLIGVGMVVRDAFGERFEEGGFARFRGAGNEDALAMTDRSDDVDESAGDVFRAAFEGDALVGLNGSKFADFPSEVVDFIANGVKRERLFLQVFTRATSRHRREEEERGKDGGKDE